MIASLLCLHRGALRHAVLVLALALAPRCAEAADFFFHDGDRPAVFLGDSITEQRLYTTLVETYTLTRFPAWHIVFRNAGWGGDTAWLARRGDFEGGLQRDVLSLHPAAVTIDFGMNDARGGDSTYPKYLDYQTRLVEKLKAAGARVALITASPEERYEPGQPGGSTYNHMLRKYADGLKEVAARENVLFVDQFTPFLAAIKAGRAAGVLSPDLVVRVVRLTNEGVHPNYAGHLIMADAILKGLNGPALVSSAELDAAAHRTVAAENCSITWQDGGADAVQFQRADQALPWPVAPECDLAFTIPGFDPGADLNRYELKVTGLKKGAWQLSIDGQPIDVYPASALAAGVNLGFVKKGPIYAQGQQLLAAVTKKNNDYFNRWRNVQVFAAPDWLKELPGLEEKRAAELARLDAQIADDEKEIERLRQPVPHVFRLEPSAAPAAAQASSPSK